MSESKIKRLLAWEPIKFLNGGVLLKIFSFTLNYILADLLSLNKEMMYIFVLLCDFLVGFLVNRFFVFNNQSTKSHKETFSKFLIAGLGFRAINWLIYVYILKSFELYILMAQAIATTIVLFMKYFVYKKIFN